MASSIHDQFNASTWLVDRQVDAGRSLHPAIRCQGQTVTYAELLDLVNRAATGLRRLGVRPEERVGMVMLDSIEFVVAFLATMRIGAVPVLTNPLLPAKDLAVILADCRARVLVISAERSEHTAAITALANEIAQVVTTHQGQWQALLSDSSDGQPHSTWTESPGFWLCTSGTTGMPKLAMHRHGDIKYTCETYAATVLQITPDDRFFSVGPSFHAYGLGNSVTFPLSVGATAILEPTRPPTPALVADIVATEKPTLFFCIPTFYAALTNADLPDDAFASVRFGVSAAEPLPAETFARFLERYGVTILDGIGSTEMLHIFVSNSTTALKPGTSGVPVEGYECRVIDDDDNDQPDGEPGQLIVRGESAAIGYWCRSDITRSTFRGPWTYTGDLYVRSSDGFLTYLGRTDDMLRVGGEWVSPAEVEAVLIEHRDVLEAAVVGERDEHDILRPIAYVIAARSGEPPDAVALTGWCKERLAGYKRPTRYEIVADLPKTATGKIQRFKLRR
jgi:benzoate-CoA ligase family protein